VWTLSFSWILLALCSYWVIAIALQNQTRDFPSCFVKLSCIAASRKSYFKWMAKHSARSFTLSVQKYIATQWPFSSTYNRQSRTCHLLKCCTRCLTGAASRTPLHVTPTKLKMETLCQDSCPYHPVWKKHFWFCRNFVQGFQQVRNQDRNQDDDLGEMVKKASETPETLLAKRCFKPNFFRQLGDNCLIPWLRPTSSGRIRPHCLLDLLPTNRTHPQSFCTFQTTAYVAAWYEDHVRFSVQANLEKAPICNW